MSNGDTVVETDKTTTGTPSIDTSNLTSNLEQTKQTVSQVVSEIQSGMTTASNAIDQANTSAGNLANTMTQVKQNQGKQLGDNLGGGGEGGNQTPFVIDTSEAEAKIEALKQKLAELSGSNTIITIDVITEAAFATLTTLQNSLTVLSSGLNAVRINAITDDAVTKINELNKLLENIKPKDIKVDINGSTQQEIKAKQESQVEGAEVQTKTQIQSQIETIQQQIDTLIQMKENLNKLIEEINNVPPITAKFEASELVTNLKNLTEAMNGLPQGGISQKLLGNIDSDEVSTKISRLAVSFGILFEYIQKFAGNTETGVAFMGVINSLNELIKSGDRLKDLSNALKASDDKIKKVKEATQTKQEKDNTLAEQRQKYQELTDTVKQYVNARKDLVTGKATGKEAEDNIQSLKEKYESLSNELQSNSTLFKESMQDKAMAPLKDLDAQLEKIRNSMEEVKNAKSTLGNVDKYIDKNQDIFKDNSVTSGYIISLKSKADELREALSKPFSQENTVSNLQNLTNALKQQLENTKTSIKDIQDQEKQQILDQQKAKYQELTDTVQKYVDARKDLATGKSFGEDAESNVQKLKEDYEGLATTLEKNDKLFNKTMQSKALAPLNDLDAKLEKARNSMEEIKNAKTILENVDKYIDKNQGALKDNSATSEYITSLKSKAEELREALSKPFSQENTVSNLQNLTNVLKQQLENTKTSIKDIQDQEKQQLLDEQKSKYDELTNAVQKYVDARRDLVTGKTFGKDVESNIQKLKENYEGLATALEKNDKLFNRTMQGKALTPLKDLDSQLEKMRDNMDEVKNAKAILKTTDSYLDKNETKYQDDATASKYIDSLKAKAQELRDALSKPFSEENTVANLQNLTNTLKQQLESTKTGIKDAKDQEKKDNLEQQKQAYDELTEAVNKYIAARKDLVTGKTSGQEAEDNVKQLKKDYEDLAKTLEQNDKLFKESMQNRALAPLKDLDKELAKARDQMQEVKDAKSILGKVDTYLDKNADKYERTEGTQKYISDLKTQAEQLRDVLDKPFDAQNTVANLQNLTNALKQQLETTKNEISNVLSDQQFLNNQAIRETNYSSIYSQAQKVSQANVGAFNEGQPEAYKQAITKLNEELGITDEKLRALKSASAGGKINKESDEYSNFVDQVKALNKARQEALQSIPVNPNDQANSLRSFDQWVAKNGVAVAKYGEQIDAFRNQLKNADTQFNLNNTNAEIAKFQAQVTEAGDIGRTFGEKLQTTFGNLGRYLMTYVSFYRIIGTIKQGINIVKEFDSAMKSIKMVTDETSGTYEKMEKASFNIADQIGSNALTIQQSMGTWLRLGKTIEESQEAAKASSWLVNVSEFDNIDEASTALVSIKQAFNDLEYEDILDKLNAVGDSFSSSTDQLASGLQGAAGVLKMQGNDINETLALLTAGNVIARNYRNIIYSTCLIALVA